MKKSSVADAISTGVEPDRDAKKIPSRRGKRAWLIYLDLDTARRLKVVAALNDRSYSLLG